MAILRRTARGIAWRIVPILTVAGSCRGPTDVPHAALQFSAIAASLEHTCAITISGSAYCWGRNGNGDLGDGTRTTRLQPVAVLSGAVQFSTLAAGGGSIEGDSFGDQTCALNSAGTAYCWGQDFGGTLTNPSGRTAPVAISGFSFQMLAVGSTHACGLPATGQAFCWGDDNARQLGDGATASRTTPAPVSGTLVFRSIVAGGEHTCALTAAGSAYCWGLWIALGDSSSANQSTPTAVAGGLVFRTLVASGGEGSEEHTCGLTADGSAYCWGYNGFGELGDGTTTVRAVPVAAAPALRFSTLAAGQDHTCGITLTGDTYCWGDGVAGQLGNGTTTSSAAPVLVMTTVRFRSLAAGAFHTCGLDANGLAYCWGGNGGLLGDGTATSRTIPTAVSPP